MSSKGRPYRYYRCRHAYDKNSGGDCPARYLRCERLEEAVWREVNRVLTNPELVLHELRRLAEEKVDESEVSRLKAVLAELQEREKRLVHLYTMGELKEENLRTESTDIASQRQVLEVSKTAGDTVQTDFAELSGSFVLKDGLLENRDLKMLAPLVRLSGGGLVPLQKRAVDYDVTATLVPSFTGQGGKDALAGVPIPIKVEGPWEHVSYKVNWKKVFGDISADPERLKHLPQNLRDAGKSFGVDLPLPKLPDVPKLLDTGQRKSPLDQLLRLQQELTKEPAESATSKKPEEKKKPLTLDPSKALKGLFKR